MHSNRLIGRSIDYNNYEGRMTSVGIREFGRCEIFLTRLSALEFSHDITTNALQQLLQLPRIRMAPPKQKSKPNKSIQKGISTFTKVIKIRNPADHVNREMKIKGTFSECSKVSN